MVDMPRRPGDGAGPTSGRTLDCVSRDGHADINKFRACGSPLVGMWEPTTAPERRRVLSVTPHEAPAERQAGGRGGAAPQRPNGAGWTAVSRAATLLVCAAFCLEPARDVSWGVHWSARRQVHTTQSHRSSAASAAPVLGRTHLGSFPPCEDQPYVERLRSPPCFLRSDHGAT